MNRPVLPAVVALQALARAAAKKFAGLDVTQSMDARFLRFLPLPAGKSSLEAVADLEALDGGGVQATLLTVKQAGSSGITRKVEHVAVTFGREGTSPSPTEISEQKRRGGPCGRPLPEPFMVSAARLYAELVPFGPAFHNVTGEVQLWSSLASARILAPDLPGGDGPLGSPFPLDAALHVACSWAQRQLGAVLFPTGYAERRIVRPTKPGGRYWCDVVPHPGDTPVADRFDITVTDEGGELHELCLGVRMADISKGKLTPPAWVLT